MNFTRYGQQIQEKFNQKGRLFHSRRRANSLRKSLTKKRGHSVVDKSLIRFLKSYSKETFGSASYWPWLALYTEVRGEFVPGWIPDDLYTVILLDNYNPLNARISAYKSFDYRLFPDFSLEPLIVKISGNLYDSNLKKINQSEAWGILNDFDSEVVIKEDVALGGSNVLFVDIKNIDFSKLKPQSSYVIQPSISQHPQLSRLNKNSVNTLRVVTFLKDNGEVEVKFSYLRFGIGNSRVDNTSAGGGFVYISDEGKLAELAYNKMGLEIGEKHPSSHIKFNSISLPFYDKVLDQCKKSHEMFPYLKFIGWDVAITENEKPVLLEWNSAPVLWVAEAWNGPFFENEVFKIPTHRML